MEKTIVLASNNKGKKKEYEEILSPLGYTVLTPRDLGIISDPEESGTTYRENSYIKANALRKKVDCPVIADDSGLEVNALDGFPGLYSSRFGDSCGSYPAAHAKLLERLKGKEDRSAQFLCCICYLAKPDGEPLYFEGECKGHILPSPHGNAGFGYDPIFHCDAANLDFGVASEEEKNAVSHRALASAKLIKWLKSKR
jgi:XTP/dITP diphosphohydrolase